MTLWMTVTMDDLELPTAVADSATELAKIVGISANSLMSRYSKHIHGKIEKCPFRKVKIEEGEDDG